MNRCFYYYNDKIYHINLSVSLRLTVILNLPTDGKLLSLRRGGKK
jgi:hypothetical protein